MRHTSRRGKAEASSSAERATKRGKLPDNLGADDVTSELIAIQRRKEQNRAAQRAFRERKEKQVVELNSQVETLASANKKLLQDLDSQQRTIDQLQAHIISLEKLREFSCDEWLSFGDMMGETMPDT